jgi:putative SOS response-associated peptidase YedK
VEEYFDAPPGDDDWNPRYNIAPTQPVPVVRQTTNSIRQLSMLKWGLIPSWASDPSIGFKTINARSETVATTASFRDAIKSQRCLIPADGFYEWRRNGTTKQPYCFEVGDGGVFAFAGLWDGWTDLQGTVVETCTILTTTPNDLLADVHDRMPVILNTGEYDVWLKPGDTEAALKLLRPYAGQMRGYPVSPRVNRVENDDAECAKPIELEAPAQARLFCWWRDAATYEEIWSAEESHGNVEGVAADYTRQTRKYIEIPILMMW